MAANMKAVKLRIKSVQSTRSADLILEPFTIPLRRLLSIIQISVLYMRQKQKKTDIVMW